MMNLITEREAGGDHIIFQMFLRKRSLFVWHFQLVKAIGPTFIRSTNQARYFY